jgi:CRISPR-associated protein Cst2
LFSSVSADAIRWAVREYFQANYPEKTNRTYDAVKSEYRFKDEKYSSSNFIDDDLLGFMSAKKDANNKDATVKRRGIVEFSRSVSLDKYQDNIVFSSTGGQKGKTSIHQSEVHYTQYHFSVTFTPEGLEDPSRALILMDAIKDIRHVGGNHARFLYDFSPESIIIRITHDQAPRIMDAFIRGEETNVNLSNSFLRKVKSGDILASELIVGGAIVDSYGKQLSELRGNYILGYQIFYRGS